jgi:hypothetical protein
MAKKPISRIQQLSARIEEHLHQFEPMDDESDYNVSRPEMEKKKKKNSMVRAGMAGAGVAGAAAIAANKEKIKAGVQSAAAGVKEAGRTAAFRGMRQTAGVMQKGSNVAGKVARETSWKKQGVRKGAASVSETLAKGAKKLRKKSMKFFDADLAATLVRIESKFRAAGV